MQEIVEQVSFMLGLPANNNVEGLQIEKAVLIAFRELKRYIKTPVEKTVPFSHRLNLPELGIDTVKVLYVQPAYPRVGLTFGTLDSGSVFDVAAAANMYGTAGKPNTLNINPIMTQLGIAQVRNTLFTDFQWKYDVDNQVVYCTHKSPKPTQITIRYVPNYKDVSEISSLTWIDYLLRMSEANMKIALGRTRSKYLIEGSNVKLDGEALLAEAHAELEAIRAELGEKKNKMVVLK